jgi:hypothetical protein
VISQLHRGRLTLDPAFAFAQDFVWWLTSGRPFHYDLIVPGVLLGRLPRSVADLQQLVSQHNVGLIVTLNEHWEVFHSPAQMQAATGVDVLWLPTPDYSAPRLTDIRAAVDAIRTTLARFQQSGRRCGCSFLLLFLLFFSFFEQANKKASH